MFNNLLHLSHPVIKDIGTGIRIMDALVKEMDRRMNFGKNELEFLPFLVCIVDEFDTFISNAGDRNAVKRATDLMDDLLRRGRKAKISMILATHDPVRKTAKVNLDEISARIAFHYAKHHNSLTALGMVGAEKLPAGGAMIFKPSSSSAIYLQGSYVTLEEIEMILHAPPVDNDDSNKFVIKEPEAPCPSVTDDWISESSIPREKGTEELAKIILWVVGKKNISCLQIQQEFHMGNRASDIIDRLYQMQLITGKFANQPRAVLVRRIEDMPENAMALLRANGISDDEITSAFTIKPVDA
jgi:DNA segregation ATPase FtsK/SpoIIIE-like protein